VSIVHLNERLPVLDESCSPSRVCGAGDLTEFAYRGNGHVALLDRIQQFHAGDRPNDVGRFYDLSLVSLLTNRREEALVLQGATLEVNQIYRISAPDDSDATRSRRALRVLALVAPGDFMVNVPLEFVTNHLDVRLDLFYVLPGRALPQVIPDHDVAFFAISEVNEAARARFQRLFAAWPRPAINDPEFLKHMARDALPRWLEGVAGVFSPPSIALSREAFETRLGGDLEVEPLGDERAFFPCLIRPVGSHAGAGLALTNGRAEAVRYLRASSEQNFYVTAFEDYRCDDGLYRKSRVAFVDRRPFLCHMAISEHWMVHYLNAGMTSSAAKRAEEARAMAEFDQTFARRHADAFAALHDRLGFDYYQIDCSETRDGRLLVFEAAVAGIIHLMDPPNLFPYKPPQMRRVFAAFDEMLHRAAAGSERTPAAASGPAPRRA
jgi:hypothetical protein